MYKQTFLTQDKTNRRQRDKGLFGEKKKKKKKRRSKHEEERESDARTTRRKNIIYTFNECACPELLFLITFPCDIICCKIVYA